MKRLLMLLLLVTIGLTLAYGPQSLAGGQIKTLNGTWELKRSSDSALVLSIRFTTKRNVVDGTYYNQGQAKKITNVRLKGKALRFNVPDQRAYFELLLVNDQFEGTMSFAGSTEKIVPVAVIMKRR